MVTTIDEAVLLFAKWQQNTLPLRIRYSNPTIVFDGVGIVRDHSRTSVAVGGDSWKFTALLDGSAISFSDPREIPVESVREIESAKYELGIAIDLESGERLILMELRQVPEVSDEPV